MGIFRKKGAAPGPDEPDLTDDLTDDEGPVGSDQPDGDAEPADLQADRPVSMAVDRSAGPWDLSERSDQDGYIDLGALRLPGVEGLEIRLEIEEPSGSVTAATVVLGGSVVQLQAFAAPRSEGIWDEIRTEIAASISQQGGTADEVPGVFGQELLGQLPARSADGKTVTQAARFAGVDGPRWFLRAVFHGPAAYDGQAAAPLEDLVRSVVVVRGADAMAPRELLALHLPPGAPGTEPVADSADQDEQPQYPIDPFERGPEITEVR
jgi:Protein of unknown function (DUF3710)